MELCLKICHLYPREMNIYGDHGNLLVLQKRCKRRGINVEKRDYHPGGEFPLDVNIVLGGGGQDSGQLAVQADLSRIAPRLIKLADTNTPMLVICGMYQLFGSYFKTASGEIIKGLGILDIYTEAGDTRMIGNIVTDSDEFGQIIGYENHSGRTWHSGRDLGNDVSNSAGNNTGGYVNNNASCNVNSSVNDKNDNNVDGVERNSATSKASGTYPLGQVIKGDGNNGQDKTEGARKGNIIGTYLHGPLLPKNPKIADFLIQKALEQILGKADAQAFMAKHPLDDSLSEAARQVAYKRPR